MRKSEKKEEIKTKVVNKKDKEMRTMKRTRNKRKLEKEKQGKR